MAIYKSGRPFKYRPAIDSGHKPPRKPGNYRIRDAQGTIIYIGETCDLYRRIREHIRSGKILLTPSAACTVEYQVADGRSTSRTRRHHEKKKIAQHKPALNKSRGGEGRVAEKPVQKRPVKCKAAH